jgi:hypothetical protein
MVNTAVAALALLAVGQAVGAVPTAGALPPTFSFVDWVDQIIADPDGDHLSPEEAVVAFYAAASSSSPSSGTL